LHQEHSRVRLVAAPETVCALARRGSRGAVEADVIVAFFTSAGPVAKAFGGAARPLDPAGGL